MPVPPAGHRPAGQESVRLDDIAHEPLVRVADPVWSAYERIDRRPGGRPASDGPLADTALPRAGALLRASGS